MKKKIIQIVIAAIIIILTATTTLFFIEIKERDSLIDKLEKEIERKHMAEWEKLIPKAKAVCLVILHSIYPNLVCNLRYEHVDAAGWWFTYELLNDRRRQTYCVGHMEV